MRTFGFVLRTKEVAVRGKEERPTFIFHRQPIDLGFQSSEIRIRSFVFPLIQPLISRIIIIRFSRIFLKDVVVEMGVESGKLPRHLTQSTTQDYLDPKRGFYIQGRISNIKRFRPMMGTIAVQLGSLCDTAATVADL